MSTVSLRSSVWTVTAGLIPGQPMPEYTRSWFYTELDYEFNWVKVEHIWL